MGNFFSLIPEQIPQWFARCLLYLFILGMGYIGFGFVSSGMVLPGDVLESMEINNSHMLNMEKKMIELQSRVITILEEHNRRLDRIEDRLDADTRRRSNRER